MIETKLMAYTIFLQDAAKDFFGYIPQYEYIGLEALEKSLDEDDAVWDETIAAELDELYDQLPKDPDELGEFAGRNCYQAWSRPNPVTANNKGYLQNILNQGHESVLEHASVTVAVKGASTALLGQLSRHRHLSFSVLSKRYVDESNSEMVIHPGLEREGHEDIIDAMQKQHQFQLNLYSEIVGDLVKDGKTRKQAREIARGVLPQATETRMVVTGNLRAWRYVIQKRSYPGADEEIQELARQLLEIMKTVAPNSFQDME